MQVTENAAHEWAREKRVDNFQSDDLFDPLINLQAGAWYLRRALEHWQTQPDPLPFALAEYNAGASRFGEASSEQGRLAEPRKQGAAGL